MLQEQRSRGEARRDESSLASEVVEKAPDRAGDPLFNANSAKTYVGGISEMTLWRWTVDPEIQFPEPDVTVSRRKFWRQSTLDQWVAKRIAQQKVSRAEGASPPRKPHRAER